jgi:diguanylate cyclase (GGDEF)-like protein
MTEPVSTPSPPSELALLNELNARLLACLTPAEAAQALGGLAEPLFGAADGNASLAAGALYLMDAARARLEPAAEWGARSGLARPLAPADCRALRLGQPYLGPAQAEASSGRPVCAHVTGPEAYLCLPLLSQGASLGLLHLAAGAGPLRPAAVQLAHAVAASLALALATLQLRERLRSQSIRDPLTGLFNRRYLEESLERDVARARREGLQVGVVRLDVDHLQPFNTAHGPAAGDALLRELGWLLQASVRAEDIACRYGGDEFALILPGASLAATRARAEQVAAAVRQLGIEHGGQRLGPVSISMGVAACPQHGSTGDALLAAAGAALQQAKRQGRDCVAVAPADGD